MLFQIACDGIGETESESAPRRIAESFSYPLGSREILTEARDKKDDWYNALDFGEENHLGEDWNKNSGGNTDCGEPVFSIADGVVVYAQHAGAGWGNVIIIEHLLPDGSRVESLYGHLERIEKNSGEVRKGELIGAVGNADGKYLCHLHFEIRTEDSPMRGQPGAGYSTDRRGWVDPSEFINLRYKP
jgi:Membrane proteins related to metalloendopeptidases